jgi:hypothetical protein
MEVNNIKECDTTNTIHKCPICLDIMDYYTPRYPNMICGKCANGNNVNNVNNGKILDSFGNEVSFGNIDISGGFISYHKINNEIVKKEDHLCWINTIKCYANEARFGGIVIQTMN